MNNAMKWMLGLAVSAALALSAGCSKDEDKKKQDTPKANNTKPNKAQPSKMPTPTPPKATELADEDLPVETDFEDNAAKEITTDTFNKELEALEKEISGDE